MKIIRSYYCKTLHHTVNVYETAKPSRLALTPIYSKLFRQNQPQVSKPTVAKHMSRTQLRNIRFFKLMKRRPI